MVNVSERHKLGRKKKQKKNSKAQDCRHEDWQTFAFIPFLFYDILRFLEFFLAWIPWTFRMSLNSLFFFFFSCLFYRFMTRLIKSSLLFKTANFLMQNGSIRCAPNPKNNKLGNIWHDFAKINQINVRIKLKCSTPMSTNLLTIRPL